MCIFIVSWVEGCLGQHNHGVLLSSWFVEKRLICADSVTHALLRAFSWTAEILLCVLSVTKTSFTVEHILKSCFRYRRIQEAAPSPSSISGEQGNFCQTIIHVPYKMQFDREPLVVLIFSFIDKVLNLLDGVGYTQFVFYGCKIGWFDLFC